MSDIKRLWKSPAGYAQGVDAIFKKPNRMIKKEVVHATEQIMSILEDTTKDAAKIISSAEEEAENIRKRAHSQGVQSGYDDVASQLFAATEEYKNARKLAEKDAIAFAFQIAGRIIGTQLENDPSLVVPIVKEVLAQAKNQKNIIVLCHPQDLRILEDNKHRLLVESQASPIVIKANESVGRGECIVETADGRIDGRLQTQLQALEKSLNESL